MDRQNQKNEKGTSIPPTDKEGYLLYIEEWTPEIAQIIGQDEGLNLSAEHWEIIHLLRDFYQEYQLSPAMRPLVKYIALHLGPEKAKSIYLMSLFPGSPAKIATKIAGLPRPANCL